MSNLIVMPGSKEFTETLAQTRKKSRIIPDDQPVSYKGRTLMLNTAVAAKFQCGGFALSQAHPFDIVPPEAQMGRLERALKEGVLLDITDQDPRKGFKAKDGAIAPVESADTDKKVFLGRDGRGRVYVVTPKNKTEAKRMEREIKRTGTLSGVNYEEQATGMSAIYEEPLAPEPKKNARTPSRKRRSRK